MVRIGRAPGFVPRSEDLELIVSQGLASRYEIRETEVAFYLMGLAANAPRTLEFRQTPTLAVSADAPASTIYAYYEPAIRAEVPPFAFDVR